MESEEEKRDGVSLAVRSRLASSGLLLLFCYSTGGSIKVKASQQEWTATMIECELGCGRVFFECDTYEQNKSDGEKCNQTTKPRSTRACLGFGFRFRKKGVEEVFKVCSTWKQNQLLLQGCGSAWRGVLSAERDCVWFLRLCSFEHACFDGFALNKQTYTRTAVRSTTRSRKRVRCMYVFELFHFIP